MGLEDRWDWRNSGTVEGYNLLIGEISITQQIVRRDDSDGVSFMFTFLCSLSGYLVIWLTGYLEPVLFNTALCLHFR